MTLTTIKKAGLDSLALDHVFTIGASGTDHYTFQGEGLNGTVNDPTLYLTRGKTYRFENGTGAHAIRIQSADDGTSGTLYNTGVTNNNTTGTVIVEVQHDAPDVLYYQCASHANMKGTIYVTGALADGGVTTAKIANLAVTGDKIGSGAIIESKISNGAITSAKIADGTIVNADINGSAAITGNKLADDTIDAVKLNSNAVTTAKIADDAVTADKLANSINTAIAANTAKDLTALSASNLTSGTIPDARFPATLPAISGANLTGITGVTINNNINNRIVTATGTTGTLEGESNLTWDQNHLRATGSGGVTLRAGSTNASGASIYLDGDSDGDWSGSTFAYINHDSSGNLYMMGRNPAGNAQIIFGTNDYNAFRVDANRHIRPESDNARDLGTSTYRWRNIYTADLHLSNKGHTNDVDGTWGQYTIQEGQDDLFLINKRSGKKYKFNLTEVS